MNYANPDALVGAEWLADHLNAPDVRVLDATYHLPGSERDAHEEYLFRHIPGAVFFNLDDVSDTESPLPHMLPSPEKFSSKVRKMGLGDGNKIVVYDTSGGFFAAMRVWWMFRVFGHKDVCVLNGGLKSWTALKQPTEQDEPVTLRKHFTASKDNTLVRVMKHMLSNVESGREQVLDARNPKRFQGEDWEPRPTKRRGHIPGSVNIPFSKLMDPMKGFRMRAADDIAAAFDKAGVDREKPMVTTCGSGITAAVLSFGLHLIGCENVPVYDGSWAEWGNHDDVPIEV